MRPVNTKLLYTIFLKKFIISNIRTSSKIIIFYIFIPKFAYIIQCNNITIQINSFIYIIFQFWDEQS